MKDKMIKIKTLLKDTVKATTNKYPKLVFVHVPKCAGSAVANSILKCTYPSVFSVTPLTTGIDIFSAAKIGKLIDLPEQKVRQVQLINVLNSETKLFVTGHCHVTPNVVSTFSDRWKFLTVLRDPVQRFVSEFVYNTYKSEDWKKNSLSIFDYLETETAVISGMSFALYFSGMDKASILKRPDNATKLAIDNLSTFYSVGFLESLDLWIRQLNTQLGSNIELKSSNLSPSKQRYDEIINDPTLLSRIKQLCKIDHQIYMEVKNSHLK